MSKNNKPTIMKKNNQNILLNNLKTKPKENTIISSQSSSKPPFKRLKNSEFLLEEISGVLLSIIVMLNIILIFQHRSVDFVSNTLKFSKKD